MIRVENWMKFQHYKNRQPPWIKLHRSLLSNKGWYDLQPESCKALVSLWLIASEEDGGIIKDDSETLAWRLHIDSNTLESVLTDLHDKGFLVVASKLLA